MCILIWINREALLALVPLPHKKEPFFRQSVCSWHCETLELQPQSYPVPDKIGLPKDSPGAHC